MDKIARVLLLRRSRKRRMGASGSDARLRLGEKRRHTVAEATAVRNKVAEIVAGPAILVSFEPRAEALLHEGKVKEERVIVLLLPPIPMTRYIICRCRA